ncbi:MAG TPA: hypothetical protein VK599_20650, partial [Streptosporangiaceae bacterium]|nr:hypothetical protein [Streptosporangiaceae bacterium]
GQLRLRQREWHGAAGGQHARCRLRPGQLGHERFRPGQFRSGRAPARRAASERAASSTAASGSAPAVGAATAPGQPGARPARYR